MRADRCQSGRLVTPRSQDQEGPEKDHGVAAMGIAAGQSRFFVLAATFRFNV